MLHVSLFVELLRSRPRFMVWAAALTQAVLWWLVPVVFYSAPPDDLSLAIAIGHEFTLGSYWGPPLAYWLAEIAFAIAGMPGVYLLAQACVVTTYWAVFRLGEAIVGIQQAAIAVLLMVGIAAFNVPTPNFGPPILGMPLTALALLHYWRAIGGGRRGYWFLLGVDLGLLVLTTHAGLILIGAIVAFSLASRRGRQALLTIEPWIGAVIVMVILFPHLLWIDVSGMNATWLARVDASRGGAPHFFALLGRQLAALVVTHAGTLVLVALATRWGTSLQERMPVFERHPLTSFERRFVLFFALALPLISALVAALLGERSPIGGTSPNVVLSGLAIVMLGGNAIEVHRQWLIGMAWTLLLIAPPLFAAGSIVAMPFFANAPLPTAQPARAIGRYFGEAFERRSGQRLAIVAGDPRFATLVALGARSRPSFYYDALPERTPWVGDDDLKRKGAVVVWPTTDTAGTLPPDIKARFPDLVPEVPRAFDYAIQGRLPLLRIGWGVLRPQ